MEESILNTQEWAVWLMVRHMLLTGDGEESIDDLTKRAGLRPIACEEIRDRGEGLLQELYETEFMDRMPM